MYLFLLGESGEAGLAQWRCAPRAVGRGTEDRRIRTAAEAPRCSPSYDFYHGSSYQ